MIQEIISFLWLDKSTEKNDNNKFIAVPNKTKYNEGMIRRNAFTPFGLVLDVYFRCLRLVHGY